MLRYLLFLSQFQSRDELIAQMYGERFPTVFGRIVTVEPTEYRAYRNTIAAQLLG